MLSTQRASSGARPLESLQFTHKIRNRLFSRSQRKCSLFLLIVLNLLQTVLLHLPNAPSSPCLVYRLFTCSDIVIISQSLSSPTSALLPSLFLCFPFVLFRSYLLVQSHRRYGNSNVQAKNDNGCWTLRPQEGSGKRFRWNDTSFPPLIQIFLARSSCGNLAFSFEIHAARLDVDGPSARDSRSDIRKNEGRHDRPGGRVECVMDFPRAILVQGLSYCP